MNRRRFLKVLGVSGAVAAVEGCSSNRDERLIPYLIPAEDQTPGVSSEYSTVCRECPAGCGMVARVRDGRAHKVEGNPEHPINRGTLCLRGQSALQDLYHPDRIRQPLARDPRGRLQPISWEEAERRLLDALAAAHSGRTTRGGRTAWIGRLETGAFDRLVGEWLDAVAPAPTRLRYEPFAYEPLREANARVFGTAVVPDMRISEARMLLSFGADFLETWVSNIQYSRAFSAWRQARVQGKHRGRYVFIGPRLSLTGANADQWIPARSGAEALIARALTAIVAAERGAAPAGGGAGEPAALAEAAGMSVEILERLGREFAAAAPSLAFPVGNAAGEDATAANEAILRLNLAAGNVDRTYILDWPHALTATARYAEIGALVAAMQAGDVRLLLVHEANPVYHLPPVLRVAEAIGRVPSVVSFSSYLDETTALASLVLPDHRPLESWGEYTPRPGITGLLQPVVMPVFDTRPTGDVLLSTAARLGRDLGAPDFHAYMRRSLGLDEVGWLAAVQRGGIFTAEDAPALDAGLREQAVAGLGPDALEGKRLASPQERSPASSETAPLPARKYPEFAFPQRNPEDAQTLESTGAPDGAVRLTLHLYPSLYFFDGRTANRPWAQEIPDPMAKAVWGSWAEIHPETARRLGAAQDDVLVLTTDAGRLDVPALVTDRVRPEVVALQLGQGHTHYTRYARGTGVNPVQLLSGASEQPSGALVMSGTPVSVSRSPVRRRLVVLQASERLVGEPVAREMTLTELVQTPAEGGAFASREEERPSFYRYIPEGKHHWGMAIDLDRCIGCNACVAACYAENNVPVVGREECARGHNMAWLRIANYGGELSAAGEATKEAATAPHDIRIRFLPMLCQQCNNAPCEYVCPVNATVHSKEGLNQMVYNRCVGTRFCSNNCPYKVRRFNWLTYEFPAPLDQQLNPDVIHRTKGVMEKCTFCIQRIRRARIDATTEGRPIRDGEIMTACQQTCPADAIVFGDLKDPNSRARRLAEGPRGYGALADLNTYPNITYMARVRAEEIHGAKNG